MLCLTYFEKKHLDYVSFDIKTSELNESVCVTLVIGMAYLKAHRVPSLKSSVVKF